MPDVMTSPVRRYVAGSSVSAFGNQMAAVALPVALIWHGASAAVLGVVLGAAILPKTVFLLAGGVIGDRLDRRAVLVAGDLLMASTQVATALLLWHGGTRQLHLLVLVQILYGCANALAVPALIGVLPQLVPVTGLQRANAVLRTAMNTAAVLGPPAAAGFAAVLRPEWALLANAVTFLVSAVAVAGLPKLSAPAERASFARELAAGWTVFRRTTWVWLMVGSFAIYQATVLPVVFVIGPLITGDAGGWAAVLTARSVGAIAGGLLLLRWRPRRPVALACALLLLDLPFLLGLTAGLGVVALVLASLVASVGLVAADTLWESALQENVDPAYISRISSYDWMGSVFFAPLGYLAVGAVAATAGTSATVVAVTVVHAVIHLSLPLARPILAVRRASS
ncbi:MFS transporter [Herbidospora galbida]|uniref:MFS transporter n=1 Tax=Herbidospora galbida TaxID=2575442 RepID=A0A4U3MRV4_9ACTN|nr:MFS transporter [Herbidospora galbida]TKK91679.1 MFS transporter [Herbidospora galbida]